MTTASRPELNWILDDLVNVPHAQHALVLSADGLKLAHSEDVDRDLGDRIAATVSGLQALSRNGGVFVSDKSTTWQQTMVQYGAGYLFVIAAGSGAHLVASAGREVDVEVFSYRMEDTVKRLGREMAVAPREPSPHG
jgi:predicted regulator of Ras-like GTPase activity (Roadblock/LC7/MglB family)